MPNVSELLSTIKDLSLVGSGDVMDDTRIMRYMNLVYKEVYRDAAKEYPSVLQVNETVTIMNGAGNLENRYIAVKQVKDLANNHFIHPTTLADLERRHPALSDTGNPRWYYMAGTKAIKTYPVNNGSILVRYISGTNTLTADSEEDDIKIPPEFHDILIWGTLVYNTMDERDKAVAGEINTAQSKFEIARDAFINWLALSQPQEPQRTEAVMGG